MKEDKMGGHVLRAREKRNTHKFVGGKPEAKRTLGRPTRRWETTVVLKEIEREV
jgi:hypothetical protein